MALTPEQIKELKGQLMAQIQHLPPEQKAAAEKQIESLSPQALELMLKQQQSRSETGESKGPQKGVFRMIIDREIGAIVVDENEDALAAMEINPISEGHVIIIPKKAISEAKLLPSSMFAMAKRLSRKITSKLKSKSTEIQTENKFGEIILNIIPVYDQPLTLASPRHKASPEDLEKLAKKLRTIKKLKVIKLKEEKPSSQDLVIKLKRRIP